MCKNCGKKRELFERLFPGVGKVSPTLMLDHGVLVRDFPLRLAEFYDKVSGFLSHEEVYELLDDIRRFYDGLSPDDIKVLNLPHYEREYVEEPKPDPPRLGFVYLIQSEDGPVKIGLTYSAVSKRLHDLQVSTPVELAVVAEYRVRNAKMIEKMLHDHFSKKHIRGEWYDLTHDDIRVIKELLLEQVI